MTTVLIFAQLAALALGPVAAFLWATFRAPLRRRTALAVGGASVAIVALAFAPISLAGLAADQAAVLLAILGIWFALIAAIRAPNTRTGVGIGLFVFVALPLAWLFLMAGGLVYPPHAVRTERLPCGRVLLVETTNKYPFSSQVVSVLWRPRLSPVEVRLMREWFRGGRMEPWFTREHAFRAVPKAGCRVDVMYGAHRVWADV